VAGAAKPPTGLPRGAPGRLDRFAEAFERLGANEYIQYATDAGPESDLSAARERVNLALSDPTRRAAVRVAVREFVDWASQAYSRRLPATDTILLFQSLPDRAEDRVRLLQSLERAVIALILWDELALEDRDALLGPWERVVGTAGEEPG
jgi:hypothetical protein